MKSRERTIYFYDVRIHSATRSEGISAPSCISMLDAIRLIAKLDLKGRHGAFKRGEKELYQIQDVKVDKATGEMQLLINHADRALADPVFKNFESRRTRPAGKQPIEGIDVSAHVLLRPSNTDPYAALLLVTYGSGVTAKFIEWLLGKLMDIAGGDPVNKQDFEFRHPSGEANKHYKVSYKFDCVGHKSQQLKDDLARGHLQTVDLISHETANIDTGGGFVVAAQTLSIKPAITAKPTLGSLIQAISAVAASTHKDFDSVRVRFKDASDNQREELFPANDLEAAFVRKERLKFETDLPSQNLAISSAIMTAMIELCD